MNSAAPARAAECEKLTNDGFSSTALSAPFTLAGVVLLAVSGDLLSFPRVVLVAMRSPIGTFPRLHGVGIGFATALLVCVVFFAPRRISLFQQELIPFAVAPAHFESHFFVGWVQPLSAQTFAILLSPTPGYAHVRQFPATARQLPSFDN